MPVSSELVTSGVQIGLAVLVHEVNKAKKFKAENTLERFLFGSDGNFSGSEFKITSFCVRTYLKDPTINKVELEIWIKSWKKNWVDYGGKNKDKFWKNREAHIVSIYKKLKAERAYALPLLRFSTVAEARPFYKSTYSDNTIYNGVLKERSTKTALLKDRLRKWKTTRGKLPYHNIDTYAPIEPRPLRYSNFDEARAYNKPHYTDAQISVNLKKELTRFRTETEKHKKDLAAYNAMVEKENNRVNAELSGATPEEAIIYAEEEEKKIIEDSTTEEVGVTPYIIGGVLLILLIIAVYIFKK